MLRRLGIVVVVVVAAGVLGIAPLGAQDGGASEAAASTVRIQARLLASGKVEFGLQLDGEREWLPQARLFPYATAEVGRWLFASPYTLSDGTVVRIQARLLASGKVEFGLQLDGEREWLPQARLFPYATAEVGRWLFASPYSVPTTEPDPPENLGPVPPNSDYWAELMRIENFAIACGWYDDEYKQCHNHPEDTEIFIRDKGRLYGCEWDVLWGICVGQTIPEFFFMLAQLACDEEGWYFDILIPACFHLDHPREGEWVSGRWTD